MQDTITKQIPILNQQEPMRKFDLEERTTDFARAVIRMCKRLPRNPINDRMVSQVVSSAGSVGANYREANDALGKKDFVMRMKISRKEAKECHHWLSLLLEANEERREDIEPLMRESVELKKILSSIITKSQ